MTEEFEIGDLAWSLARPREVVRVVAIHDYGISWMSTESSRVGCTDPEYLLKVDS